MLVLNLPTAYPFVLIPVTLSFLVNLHHLLASFSARRKTNVKRPRQHADWDEAEKNPDLMKFNIAQRSHANFLENYPSFLASILISGLVYPRTSTIIGLIWVSARMCYHYGYSSSNTEFRTIGWVPGTLSLMGLWVLSGLSVSKLLGEAEWKW